MRAGPFDELSARPGSFRARPRRAASTCAMLFVTLMGGVASPASAESDDAQSEDWAQSDVPPPPSEFVFRRSRRGLGPPARAPKRNEGPRKPPSSTSSAPSAGSLYEEEIDWDAGPEPTFRRAPPSEPIGWTTLAALGGAGLTTFGVIWVGVASMGGVAHWATAESYVRRLGEEYAASSDLQHRRDLARQAANAHRVYPTQVAVFAGFALLGAVILVAGLTGVVVGLVAPIVGAGE